MREIEQCSQVVFFVVGGSAIDEEENLKAAHEGGASSCLAAQVGHYARYHHLGNALIIEIFLQVSLVESIILIFAQNVTVGEIKISSDGA